MDSSACLYKRNTPGGGGGAAVNEEVDDCIFFLFLGWGKKSVARMKNKKKRKKILLGIRFVMVEQELHPPLPCQIYFYQGISPLFDGLGDGGSTLVTDPVVVQIHCRQRLALLDSLGDGGCTMVTDFIVS